MGASAGWVGAAFISSAAAAHLCLMSGEVQFHRPCTRIAAITAGEHIESYYSRRYGPDQAAALRQRLHDSGELSL